LETSALKQMEIGFCGLLELFEAFFLMSKRLSMQEIYLLMLVYFRVSYVHSLVLPTISSEFLIVKLFLNGENNL